MQEDSLLTPVSPYGVTKLAGENLCYLYWKNYGVPTVSLRNIKYIEKQKGDVSDTWADVSKAEAKLDWTSKVDISNGIKSFIEWFLS